LKKKNITKKNMKTQFIILSLLIVSSIALTNKKPLQAHKNIEALKKDKSWSKIILTLAELHMMSEDNAVNDLLEAVVQLVEDLQEKQERQDNYFQEKTSQYRADVGKLQGEIDSAITDVSIATEDLQNNLYPRRKNLQDDIVSGEQHLAENKARLEKIKNLREQERAAYLERQEEHESALSALDEALNLLEQLAGSSFVQVKFAKTNLQKIQNKLGKHLHETLAKALVQLATSEFADARLVRDVIEKLSQIQQNIKKSQADEKQQEQLQQKQYDEEVQRLEQNNLDTLTVLNSDKLSLDATNYSIDEQEKFKAQRESDLAGSQADLQHTNENYEQLLKANEELSAQLASELSAASEALEILQNGEFTEYIRQRLSSF
ncbi:hypothetical protein IMG5_145750, partial [Ichthyophthirius multifiliis]